MQSMHEYKSEIPEKYNDMYVYGIGMEDNPNMEKSLKRFWVWYYIEKKNGDCSFRETKKRCEFMCRKL